MTTCLAETSIPRRVSASYGGKPKTCSLCCAGCVSIIRTPLTRVRVFGFDMQVPGLAQSNVLDYLRRVDPEAVDTAAQVFEVSKRPTKPYALLPLSRRDSIFVDRS